MKNKTSHQGASPFAKGVTIVNSEKGIYSTSREELEKLHNSPEYVAFKELRERLENGTATEDERKDEEVTLARMRRIPKNQIIEDTDEYLMLAEIDEMLLEDQAEVERSVKAFAERASPTNGD